MGLFSPSFLFGLVVLLYLGSFVVFALLRIATGISIQRIGYFSLRRIAYTPRDGIRIEIRGLGLHLHRPTFGQPTWVSLRLTELKVTLDVKALNTTPNAAKSKSPLQQSTADSNQQEPASSSSPKPILRHTKPSSPRSRTWKRLTNIKERLKQLHGKIHWLKLVDVEAMNSSFVVAGIGQFEVGTLNMLVDTRRKTVDRGRLFQHKKIPAGDQTPAEWMFVMKGLLFTPDGKDSLDLIDMCTLNIHGLLYKDMAGLRDTSISLKLGRVHVPYDDLADCYKAAKQQRKASELARADTFDNISISDLIEELDRPGSREAKIVQTVSDSKEFVSSILRGIQEIQMAVSAVGVTKEVRTFGQMGSPVYLNVSMNEFGIDMHRLDPKSPAHRLYFSTKDIAHQALLAAISIAVSLDDGKGELERLLYIPMATTTVKTTLPSKTVAFSEDKNAAERNANILFANQVVTSPSIDLDPKHMPLVLALLNQSSAQPSKSSSEEASSHRLFSRLLPKASINFSVHEPVMRIALPPADPKLKGTDEYDILVCAISSISLNAESSHSSAGELHYALTSNLRVSSCELYYHTAACDRHNLLLVDTLGLKVQLKASPQVCIVATGDMQTLSIHLIRPEISNGLRQIVQQLKRREISDKKLSLPKTATDPNFLRPLPLWLVEVSFQGSNFGIEIAGVDGDVSRDTRGVAFQLESWTADYKQKRDAPTQRPQSRRTVTQKATNPTEPSITVTPPAEQPKNSTAATDGRRLAVHVRGFEGFVLEGTDKTETDSFVSMPRFEVAFSTSSDNEGPIFHINTHLKALYIQYSLYRYYSFGVATKVIQRAFAIDQRNKPDNASSSLSSGDGNMSAAHGHPRGKELVTIDLRNDLLQIKAKMPADPPMMLEIMGVETGRHRWAKPFFRSQVVRLFVEAPGIRNTWARFVVIKAFRADLREVRKKRSRVITEEKSFDLANDFIRISVPHGLVLYKVVDNIVNVAKASKQLHHRFKTGTNEYILEQKPEEPKQLPRISIRSKVFLFDVEDGPFDWKLSTIYRVGLIEQKQRLAREEAYYAKVKHVQSSRHKKASLRPRDLGAQNQPRSASQPSQPDSARDRKDRPESRTRHRSSSPRSHRRFRTIRYDPEGQCSLSQETKVSADEAWQKLQKYNAQSWKKRIDTVYGIQGRGMREIRGIFWGGDLLPGNQDSNERIIQMSDRPGLSTTLISDLLVVIDKPSFPIKDYPKFINSVGKGMPLDMQYSLLIPMNIQINMGEARVTLRDYPLPLLHVPAIRPGQSPRLPSWSLKTDFVIAEEYRGPISTRQVAVEVVPGNKISSPASTKGFAIDVRRTVSPVKTYSDVDVSINTGGSTKITWGTSYQPAIQDLMMVIEAFTRPQLDPSSRVGFWDKIRLSAHSRVLVSWKGDGDVHLQLKGSRDPYVVTGAGAGFVMVWREDVRWAIHREDDPRKFLTVDSGEYALAIPDYSHQAREAVAQVVSDRDSISSSGSSKTGTAVRKTVMKLSGNVRWLAGLVFERNLEGGGRSFEFRPHYDITLTTPERAKAPPGQEYDAFRGFRSDHIHLSIAIAAPRDRDWTTSNKSPSPCYNSIHLTPRFFTHFYDWWSLFSGVMSLPIRQGKLFPGVEKSSKKFGRHLGTIKYNLLLSPLFIAHVYKHKDAEDYVQDTVSATGLKLRLDSFMLDLHQRREEFAAQGRGRAKQMKASAMKINQAQLDLFSADIRAVSANITGTSHNDLKRASDGDFVAWQQNANSVELSHVSIPDEDHSWVDADDFVELGWILPSENDPPTSILPLAYAPRFTYFRQTDHKESGDSGDARSSPFGDEPTHFCIMSQDNDPRQVQRELIQQRIDKLEDQIKAHQRTVDEQELHVVRDSHRDGSIKERFQMLKDQSAKLEAKRQFLIGMVQRLDHVLAQHRPWESTAGKTVPHFLDGAASDGKIDSESEALETAPMSSAISSFNNRFIVHNVQLKWNNSLRNIILRYAHQVSQRRGFVYYLSRRAVKFILDIVEEQSRSKQQQSQTAESEATTPASESHPSSIHQEGSEPEEASVEDRINELLNDGKRFVDANDPEKSESSPDASSEPPDTNISSGYAPLNTYFARMIAPQIQFLSEKNPKSILLVTAKSMQLKVIQIMDKERMTDDVSGLVQRRFTIDMDSMQSFVTTQKIIQKFLHLHSANRYGSALNSSWPPWVPFEVNFDFDADPFGWSRVVQRTSASLRYDKHNNLRLKYNDKVSSGRAAQHPGPESQESRIDHLWVDFPHLRAICDSTQYYTMYVIVLDLLLYNEPLEKVRSEKLEKIMLASDFSDLRGAPEMVVNLQARIRQLEEIKTHFQIHAKYLDRQGWQDHLAIEEDLASCEDELFFLMKAITTSQRKMDDRNQGSQATGLLRWYLSASEIVWHLMRDTNDPLAEIQLNNALYDRTDNSDGSNFNRMEIERMHGLNLLPNALYPEMLGPYYEGGKKFMDGEDPKMLKVNWHSLEPIAGIPVLDQFEVDLYPLKVQLERVVGQKLFEYIFPGVHKHGKSEGFSPLMAKQVGTNEDSDRESDSGTISSYNKTPKVEINGNSDDDQWSPTALDSKVRATTSFPETHSSTPNRMKKGKSKQNGEGHHFHFFQHSNQSNQSQTALKAAPPHTASRKPSAESLAVSRHSREGSQSNLSALNAPAPSRKRGLFKKSNAPSTAQNGDREKASDDLSQMVSRASNYMTLAYVKIPSVVLCLSYKGKGERNIEDVFNFVFRMPALEYRNKTWSNLDLALRLKKDVIRALVSHTGAIIGNKFSHHRPGKNQQSRLRELATSSALLPNKTNLSSNNLSDSSSIGSSFLLGGRDVSQASITSDSNFRSPLSRTDSFASSLRSQGMNGNGSRPQSIHEDNEDDSPDEDNALKIMRSNFTKRFTGESSRAARTNTASSHHHPEEDTEESNRKKSVLLLGKKILGSLN